MCKMCLKMIPVFHRRIFMPVCLLKERLATVRHCYSSRTLKTAVNTNHSALYRLRSSRLGLPYKEDSWRCAYRRASRPLSDGVHTRNSGEIAADGRWSNRCDCCGLNSKGSQELALFLADELKLEKQFAWTELPKLHGFQLTSASGPSVVLTRTFHGEIVRIRFNVTKSLFEDVLAQFENTEGGVELEDTDDDVAPQLVSKPAFEVEIDRGDDTLLVIYCVFDPQLDLPSSSFDSNEDSFSIDGAALIPRQQQRLTDEIYNHSYVMTKNSIPARLKIKLLAMLSRRGIGPQFAQELVELSTAYEHQCYVNFLEQLKTFLQSVPAVT